MTCDARESTGNAIEGWHHPRGTTGWWLETGLGCAVALVVFQLLTGLMLALAADDQLGSRIGPMHVPVLLTWHVRAGIAALIAIPLLALGHPAPRPGPGGATARPCTSPLVRGLGTLTGMTLAVLVFSGPAIAASRACGLTAPRAIVEWHALAGKLAGLLLPLHLMLAVAGRHRRWARRAADAGPPRFRGHWRAPALVLFALLTLRLAQSIGLMASP